MSDGRARWTNRLLTTLTSVVLMLTLLYGAGSVRAHEGSWIDSAYTTSPPAIDGTMAPGEWTAAAVVNLSAIRGNGLTAYLLVANNDTFLFVAYDAVGDTMPGRVDSASVAFDTGHDLAITPGREDEFFWGNGAANGQAHYVSDGTAWQIQDSPFNTSLPNEAGLAAASGFGPSDLDGIPHAVYELQIPLALLGLAPGDAVGFAGVSHAFPGVVDADGGFRYSTWPTFLYGTPTLDQYGDLRLGKASQPIDLALNPPSQSHLMQPSTSFLYAVSAVNRGNAQDTFNINVTSTWPATVFNATGTGPLPDTDADGLPDTGTVAAGATANFTVRVGAPPTVGCAETELLGSSRNNPAVTDLAVLRSCVPPALLNPPHSDRGVDTDVPPNGLYDELQINASVFVAIPDVYAVQVLLYDQSQSRLIVGGFLSSSLPPGPEVVPVTLPGLPIYRSGGDGPYVAVIFLLDGSGNLLDQGSHATAAYRHADFDPPDAVFNPPHSDRGVDTDVPPNGLYDLLAVNASLAVNTAGTYGVSAELDDRLGRFITTVAATASLGIGNQVIELNFPGRDINMRGLDGPYDVRMDLADDMGNPLDNDTYATAAYLHTDFDPPGALLSPPHGDRGVDLTIPPDGLYEFLEVNVSVQVAKAGRYGLVVGLFDSSRTRLIGIASTTVDLTVGLRHVPMWFDGLQIVASGIDGPYVADIVLSDSMGFLDESFYTTASYAVSNFAPAGATFTPPHADRLVDADGDGRADFLAVDVSLNVLIPGTYSVSALLQDFRGAFLGIGSGCGAPLPAGPATCTVMFGGHAIADLNADGPFFAILRLYDAYGRLLDVGSHTTQAYPASAFEPSDTTAPAATASAVPYWINQAPLAVPFIASDPAPTDGLASVTAWYRHSMDNATWEPWTSFLTIGVTSNPASGSVPFSFPDGVGFYEFQYTAADIAGNAEALGAAEAQVSYRPATALAFAPSSITFTAGQQVTVQVRVLGPDGQPAILESPLTVALYSQSRTAQFRAVGTSTPVTNVTIPAGVASASVDYFDTTAGTWGFVGSSGPTTEALGQATVNARPAASVAVSPASPAVPVGRTQQFTAQAFDAYGNAVAASFTWSADPAVGTIDGTGLLTAATRPAFGNVTVAVVGSPTVTAIADVTLVVGRAASVVVAPSPATVVVGRTQTFTALVLDSYGNAAAASVTWSATAAIGTITASGVLTAANTVASGTVTATVVGSPSITGTSAVTLVPGAASTITLSPTSATLAVDGTTAFTATVRDALGNAVANAPLSWSVGGGVGSVSASGVFTAGHAIGSGQVQATSGTATASAAITVTAGPVARVVVSPPSSVLNVGTTQAFTANVFDQYGNEIPGASVSWTASGPGSLTASTGATTTLNAASAGSVTVTARSGSVTATAAITVLGPPEPSNAPVVGAGALVAGLLVGLGVGWIVRGRRGRKREAEPPGEEEAAKDEEL